MPLTSRAFRDNKRLQDCLVDDKAHLTPGCQGDYVSLVHQALQTVDNAAIKAPEVASGLYGSSTAAAVLDYKTSRKIINTSYQTKPDNIVGKMTIKALDDEMRGQEVKPRADPDDRCPFLYPRPPREPKPILPAVVQPSVGRPMLRPGTQVSRNLPPFKR